MSFHGKSTSTSRIKSKFGRANLNLKSLSTIKAYPRRRIALTSAVLFSLIGGQDPDLDVPVVSEQFAFTHASQQRAPHQKGPYADFARRCIEITEVAPPVDPHGLMHSVTGISLACLAIMLLEAPSSVAKPVPESVTAAHDRARQLQHQPRAPVACRRGAATGRLRKMASAGFALSHCRDSAKSSGVPISIC